MDGSNLTAKILENTPFKYPCSIYKENAIPILKDYNVSDQCKDIGKQILNMTKNPLSQHVDVLVPSANSDDYYKPHIEHFKSFFGSKYTLEQQQLESSTLTQKDNMTTTIASQNVFGFECNATKPIIEFISTEETYVEMLDDFVTKIMKPIKESINNPNKTPILDQYSFNRIFINIEDILHVNKSFLHSLKEYENGTTSESFGQILTNHMESFDCYKVYLLGKPNSLSCHSQNLKQNKTYAKFLLNKSLQKNFGMSDVLISPVQRMARYDLMIRNIISALHSNNSDIVYLKETYQKVGSINDMRYGSDSSLLNLYYLIREAPASLIQTRKLLGYFDASELSLLTGKTHRPVTILVFTDKIMVVKRKNYNLQSKDYLENIEEKVNVGSTNSNTLLQKAKEVYNGLPLEFKGWADINTVEIFNGLKDRPDTFFLRTSLPEINPNATEIDSENYFRRSDRLYSIIPSTTRTNSYIEKKKELISLCQKQSALSKLKETTELYYEDKFKLPAFTHIYDQDSYNQAEHKNNILIVYVKENSSIDLASLLTDNVWIVILLTHHESGGYKPTIRARTSLIPIRDISREMEYESIVGTNGQQKKANVPLDFIDTLWNNLFFYERRLRATEAFSAINDDLLRERARSRSRSKSLTRVASNMSIGKLFARSRSTSPSRHSSSNERTDDEETTTTQQSCVPDPIFKVATVNKQTGDEFRTQYSPPPSLSHKSHSGPAVTTSSINDFYASPTAVERGYKPSRINTQPHYRYNADSRMNNAAPPSEIFVRDDHTFIDSFNDIPKQEEILYSGANHHQDNSYHRRPSYSTTTSHRHGSISGASTLDAMLFQQSSSSSPELMSRPSSGGSHSSASSETDRTLSRGLTMGDSVSSNTSSIRSYFDENHYFSASTSSTTRSNNSDRYRSYNSTSYDERLMNTLDAPRRANVSSTSSRRAPLHAAFYSNPNVPQQQPQQQHQPPMAHRSHTMPDMVSANINQLKDDVNGLIDDLIYSQQHQLRTQQDAGRYYNNTYESVQGLRSHIVSKIDNFMENLHHSNSTPQSHHHYQLR